MKKCILCKTDCPDEAVSPKGICLNCLQKLFDQIQRGGKEQKNAIATIDSFYMIEKMERSILSDYWSIEDLIREGQRGRYERSLSKDCTPESFSAYDRLGIFVGSGGNPYETSLTECTCYDFQSRHLPCKHMYRLAYELDQK